MKERIIRLIFKEEKGKFGLNEKAIIFLFCFLLSTFFWLLAALSKTYSTSFTVQLECKSTNPNWIIKENAKSQLSVGVTGTGFALIGEQLSLNKNAISVEFDAPSGRVPNQFVLNSSDVKQEIADILDAQLRIDQLSPEVLYFEAKKLGRKSIPIRPILDLDFKDGYQLMGELIIEPSSITITGPEDELEALDELVTKRIQLNEIEDSVQQELSLDLDEISEHILVPEVSVKAMVPVEKITEKKLIIKLEAISAKYELLTFPEEVEVRVLVPLSKYESLNASSMRAIVDTKGIELEEKKLEVSLMNKPDFIKLIRIDPPKVEYIIMK